MTFADYEGRPVSLLDDRESIKELLEEWGNDPKSGGRPKQREPFALRVP